MNSQDSLGIGGVDRIIITIKVILIDDI